MKEKNEYIVKIKNIAKIIDEEYENSLWYLSLSEEEITSYFNLEKSQAKAVIHFLLQKNRYVLSKELDEKTSDLIERLQIDPRYSRNSWIKSKLVQHEAEILLEIGAQMTTPFNGRIQNLEIEDKHVIKLILPNQKLKAIPNSIGRCNKLKVLNLQENQLVSLPSSISHLVNLETLDVDYNNLTSLPEDLGNLLNLKYLWIRYNQLKEIPESIIKLKKLVKFSWDNNPQVKIPPEVKEFNAKFWKREQQKRPEKADVIRIGSTEYRDEYVLKICVISYPDEIAQDLIQQLTEHEHKEQYTMFLTIGVTVTPYRLVVADQRVKLLLWHPSSLEIFNRNLLMKLEGGYGIIIIINKTDRKSFQRAEQICQEIKFHFRDQSFLLYIFGIPGITENEETVDNVEIQALANDFNAEFYEYENNISDGFNELLGIITGKYILTLK